jgi:hypothetical protein
MLDCQPLRPHPERDRSSHVHGWASKRECLVIDLNVGSETGLNRLLIESQGLRRLDSSNSRSLGQIECF